MILRRFAEAILLIVIAPVAAHACACSQAPPGACPGLQKDDTVFLGTVTASEDIALGAPSSSDSPGSPVDIIASRLVRYHFHVDERFAIAGPPDSASEIDIFSGGEDGDCGFRFKPNERYVVFTHQGGDGHLYSTICDGTRLAAEARALLPQLRAMRNGQHVASVFGILRRTDPPFLSPPDDPEDPVGNISLKLRSTQDRFETSTNSTGVYSFYDVHAGEYRFTANLPPRTVLTQKSLSGGLPPFQIPDGACYEYDVDVLPTGHIRGSVVGPDGKPLKVASVELYRAGSYSEVQPGLWSFQSSSGFFDFDHVGPGEYVVVYNRANRTDPNSPFARTFYPSVADAGEAGVVSLKDGQQLSKVNIKLKEGYPTRSLRVRLKWSGPRPPGTVTIMAKADQGENPAAEKIGDGLYQFTLLQSGSYTISGWEDITPPRPGSRPPECTIPARIDAPPVVVSGADPTVKGIELTWESPACVRESRQ